MYMYVPKKNIPEKYHTHGSISSMAAPRAATPSSVPKLTACTVKTGDRLRRT